jgi:hypothetical protein
VAVVVDGALAGADVEGVEERLAEVVRAEVLDPPEVVPTSAAEGGPAGTSDRRDADDPGSSEPDGVGPSTLLWSQLESVEPAETGAPVSDVSLGWAGAGGVGCELGTIAQATAPHTSAAMLAPANTSGPRPLRSSVSCTGVRPNSVARSSAGLVVGPVRVGR